VGGDRLSGRLEVPRELTLADPGFDQLFGTCPPPERGSRRHFRRDPIVATPFRIRVIAGSFFRLPPYALDRSLKNCYMCYDVGASSALINLGNSLALTVEASGLSAARARSRLKRPCLTKPSWACFRGRKAKAASQLFTLSGPSALGSLHEVAERRYWAQSGHHRLSPLRASGHDEKSAVPPPAFPSGLYPTGSRRNNPLHNSAIYNAQEVPKADRHSDVARSHLLPA
jgi:hypothetical protein